MQFSDNLSLDEEPIVNIGQMGFSLPLSLNECEIESSELDRYLPQHPTVSPEASQPAHWLLNR